MEIFKEENFFPTATFFLALTILIIFLLTFNNLVFFENLFGFRILQFPNIYDTSSFLQFLSFMLHFFVTLVTYTFIHADLYHLIGNMVMLIIVGLAVEEKLGRGLFLSTYILSGNIAAIFDIIGRVSLGIPFNIPFIGSSGAIFGLMAVGGLVKPMEKIPTVLVLLTFLPLVYLVSGLGIFSDMTSLTVLMIFTIVLIVIIIPIFPSYIPLSVAIIIYLVSWLISFLIKYPLMVSNVGHLGGMVGGIIAFFLFAKKSPV
jgi:membrane associated rhomboid family serine protease